MAYPFSGAEKPQVGQISKGFAFYSAFNPLLTIIGHPEWMKHRIAPLALIVTLAACGAQPAPEFFGAQRVDTSVNGRNYTVFFTDDRVEVIRLGYAVRGEHAGIRADMIGLIPQVTGCKLNETSLKGDSGEMRASIRCPKI
jgi:hypothetical protein